MIKISVFQSRFQPFQVLFSVSVFFLPSLVGGIDSRGFICWSKSPSATKMALNLTASHINTRLATMDKIQIVRDKEVVAREIKQQCCGEREMAMTGGAHVSMRGEKVENEAYRSHTIH